MYLSWLEPCVKSKAKRESLNVRPVKPHIHAKLTFVCTIMFTFMSLLRVRGARLRLSFTVSHETFPPTWVLFFNWILFFFPSINFDVKCCPTDWKHMGYFMRIGYRKWRSFLWSNTVPYLSCQAQIPLHCLISMFLPIIGLTAWNVWTQTSWFWSSGQSKKAWKDDVTGKLWKEIAFLWRCQYSSLAHYHYNS